MDTFGNTGNEGQRGYDGDYDDGNTYGPQGNEPSRHHGNNGHDGDNDSTHQSQPSGNGGGGYQNSGGRNTGGNEPSRHGPYNPNTYGPYGNEPSRHRDIDIFVKPDNRNPVPMTANLDWTLDKLHSSSARKCNLHPSQCHSSCAGVPLSGSRKVHETSIRNGSTVNLHVRVKGG